jgi:hypothetical protein
MSVFASDVQKQQIEQQIDFNKNVVKIFCTIAQITYKDVDEEITENKEKKV